MSIDDETAPPDRGGPGGVPAYAAPGRAPAHPSPVTATADVLAAYDDEPPRRASWLLVAGVAAVVLALVAGVTYGVRSLSGGGSQPEDTFAAGAFVFAEIDLDPPAGQKVDAFRFLRQFPGLRERLTTDDLRRVVFDAVARDAGWDDIDYATQVEPWLGQRLAVAAYPPGRFGSGGEERGLPTVVVALQVTDERAAEEGLQRLVAEAGENDVGFVVDGEYAVLAETRDVAAEVVATGAEAPLRSAAEFSSDMSGLGDGIASAWVDMNAAANLAGRADPLSLGAVGNLAGVTSVTGGTGRAAYVVRFDGPDVLEVAGRFTDATALEGIAPATLTGLTDLPASTVAALGLAGGETLVGPMWRNLQEQAVAAGVEDLAAGAEQWLGLDLPGDLETLLGSNLVVAVDGEALAAGRVDVGMRATTDGPRTAVVVERLARLLGELEPDTRWQLTGDGYVVATGDAMLRRLSGGDGGARLGDTDAFRRALPDVEDARLAVWVDVAPLVSGLTAGLGGPAGGDRVDPDLEPLVGLGMTLATADGGRGEFRMRLVTD